jgi:hypothetical protein
MPTYARRNRNALVIVLAVVTLALVSGVFGISPAGGQPVWTPTGAPLPTSLPNGGTPSSMTLNATSCSSSSFCVAVGEVSDTNNNNFPLVETYSQGVWSPSVAPMPANVDTSEPVSLSSVSCPSDGTCAAVGEYYPFAPVGQAESQTGFLESLTSGVWTPTEAAVPQGTPTGPLAPLVYVYSVSCSDPTTCMAVGYDLHGNGNGGAATTALVYTWSSGSWQLTVPSLPSSYNNFAVLDGVSCPDTGVCTAVGYYEDAAGSWYGLILTLDSGTWTPSTAPTPANAFGGVGQSEELSSVDCPDVGACLAGGYYIDSNQNQQPLLLQLQGGVWTASEAPTPVIVGNAGTYGSIEGVSCPALGACVATGFYALGGLIWTQSNGAWEVTAAPLPTSQTNDSLTAPTASVLARPSVTDASAAVTTTGASLSGVGCATDAFCAATGAESTSSGLLETAGLSSLPSVTGVLPSSGPGGTAVTVTGTNFTPTTSVSFGGVPASTSYVNPTELQAVAPSLGTTNQTVDVTVTDGTLTSRSSYNDLFAYVVPPSTSVLIPSKGATLSGSTHIDAGASNATSVEFLLYGGTYGFSAPVICTATPTLYGWLCDWNTTTVPDGSYVLVSEASGPGGSTFSSGVGVTVENPLATTSVLIPSKGATLSGSTHIDAGASNATSVEFRLFGGTYGFSAPVICTATPTLYGWLCDWNTTTVPDGSYVLVSEAFNSTGSAFSAGVGITVNN